MVSVSLVLETDAKEELKILLNDRLVISVYRT